MADAKCGSSAAQMIARTSSKGKEKMEGQSRYTNSTDFSVDPICPMAITYKLNNSRIPFDLPFETKPSRSSAPMKPLLISNMLAAIRRIQRELPGHILDAFDSFRLEAVGFISFDIDELAKQRPHKPYTGRLIPVAFAMCAFGLTLVLGFGGVFGKAEGPDSPLNFVHLLLTLGSPFIGAYVGEALIKSRERSYDDLRSNLEARVSDLRSRQGNWMQMNCPAQLTLVPDLLAQWRVS